MVNLVLDEYVHAANMDTSEHFDLIKQYANVCNQALLKNKERFPFKQILGAVQDVEREEPVEVVVSDVMPPETYVFRLRADGVAVEAHALCANCKCVRSWSTNVSYLQDVVRNPQAYVDNPAKLDWEWMYDS